MARAQRVLRTNTKLVWGVLSARIVLQIQSLWLAVLPKAPVNVTLGTRDKMEQHARSAVSTNTKQTLGLLIARHVHQILSLQLAASPSLHVNVVVGTRGKMEKHAHRAW